MLIAANHRSDQALELDKCSKAPFSCEPRRTTVTAEGRSDKKCFIGKIPKKKKKSVFIVVLRAAINLSGNRGRCVFNIVVGTVEEGGLL